LLGLKVGGRLLLSLHSSNKAANARNSYGHDDSTECIDIVIIVTDSVAFPAFPWLKVSIKPWLHA